MPATSRRAARERALGLLYEADSRSISAAAATEAQPAFVDEYAEAIAFGVTERAVEIDAAISRFSHGWDIHRMPVTDRAILRIAVWELQERTDVPTAVVISEAVELAKRYSTEDSSRFVNGVLSAVAAAVR